MCLRHKIEVILAFIWILAVYQGAQTKYYYTPFESERDCLLAGAEMQRNARPSMAFECFEAEAPHR
jgi:hypothetical protein